MIYSSYFVDCNVYMCLLKLLQRLKWSNYHVDTINENKSHIQLSIYILQSSLLNVHFNYQNIYKHINDIAKPQTLSLSTEISISITIC